MIDWPYICDRMNQKISPRQERVLNVIDETPNIGISTIKEMLSLDISTPSLNRDLAELVHLGFLHRTGKGRYTRYQVSSRYLLQRFIDTTAYFQIEPDKRKVFKKFNSDIFKLLENEQVFTGSELKFLEGLTQNYQERLKNYSSVLYNKEFERLTIELSWKSAQIEGNTYDLLDTEKLLKYKIASDKHSKEEAIMLLNHKYAIEYLRAYPEMFDQLKAKDIEDVHALLVKDLGVTRNIRSRLVGITGTQYRPPDNEFQIKEYLEEMCLLINRKNSFFEKAILSTLLISYIQPFEDGNKRTGRIICNGILMNGQKCPLSYRSVDSVDYKKAMLLFYEQNNLWAFKDIFMNQYQFAVENYFL